MNDLLEEYKKLPKIITDNLDMLAGYQRCFERNKNISDEMIELITSLARECWRKDEYSKASISDYADYLLDAVYEYDGTEEQLKQLDVRDIVSAFNDEYSAEKILKFDTSDFEYEFSTIDGLSYFSDGDGYYILNDKGRCIEKTSPMNDMSDIVFGLFKENKIDYVSFPMHYNIRCMINNDIINDSELEEKYKDGIKNYEKYCLDRYITSEDILDKVDLDNEISLTDIDGQFTNGKKMERLSKYFHNIDRNGNNYSYVASLNNGTDYYHKKGKYLALDKNNIVKEFEAEDKFLFKELKGKYKFAYISPEERKKMASSVMQDYNALLHDKSKNNLFNNRNLYEVNNFFKYESDKEVDSFDNPFISTTIKMHIIYTDMVKQDLKTRMRKEKELGDSYDR